MKNADQRFKDQINFLRFSLVVGLVFLHYGAFPGTNLKPWDGISLDHYPVASSVNSFFYFFFLSSVPVLSAISGYLFFKETDYSAAFYLRRYRSRVKSILLPMISWNALALVIAAAVLLAFPNSDRLISYDPFNLRWKDLVNALVGLTRHPVHFQFWFLHDLLLTVLCAPLLGIAIRRLPWLGLAAVFAIWITNWNFWGVFFRADVLFFFFIGAMAQIQKWEIDRLVPSSAAPWILAAFACLVGLRVLAPLFVPLDQPWSPALISVWNDSLRLLGLIAMWGIAPLLVETSVGRLFARIGVLAFFLHAIHWPMNQAIKKAVDSLYHGSSDVALLVNLVVTTALSVLFAIGIAWVLNAVAPAVLNHLSGGRGGLWSPRTRGAGAVALNDKVSVKGVG